MTTLITQGNGDRNCVYAAISILRAALGYQTSYPDGLDHPQITDIPFIVVHAVDFFPDHEVSVFCVDAYRSYTRNWKGVKPDFAAEGNFLWMFDYSTAEEKATMDAIHEMWQTHTVVGLPHHHRGMFGNYAIRVKI